VCILSIPFQIFPSFQAQQDFRLPLYSVSCKISSLPYFLKIADRDESSSKEEGNSSSAGLRSVQRSWLVRRQRARSTVSASSARCIRFPNQGDIREMFARRSTATTSNQLAVEFPVSVIRRRNRQGIEFGPSEM